MADNNGGNPASAEASNLSSRIHAFKNGLFGTLFVMQKKHSNSPFLTVLGSVIKWLQIMSFLFISNDFKWDSATIAPIKYLSLIPSPAGWFKVMDYIATNVVFFVSFVWVIVFVSLMTWAMRSFLKGVIPQLWPLHLLSSIGSFSATVAYIPLLTVLLSVFMCGTGASKGTDAMWGGGFVCYQGAHLALTIISALFAAVFIALASLFALVFYDSHPLTSNYGGKVHGRADLFLLILKTILIFTIEIFPHEMGGPWTLIAINIAAGVAWVSIVLSMMPMVHQGMNSLYLSLSCLYLWGGICLAITQAMPAINGAVILYVGAPTAVAAGLTMGYLRRKHVMSLSISKMNTVYEVEMRARYTLHSALHSILAHSTDVAARMESAGVADNDDGSVVVGREVGFDSPRDRSPSPAARKKGGDQKSRRSGMADENDIGLLAATYAAMESEARAGLIRDRLPSRIVHEVEALYKSAVVRFPTSAMLHLFQARFYSTYKDDKHLNVSHLLLANRLNPGLDVAYLSFQERRSAENGAGSGVLSSAMHRVSFDKHLTDAKLSTLRAAQAQVAFWSELSDPKPDINLLHSVSTELANHTQWAEEHFKEVFALHPQSLSAMRLFAQYNLTVANNPEKAAAISAEADRIEDQKNKEQNAGNGTNSNNFTLMEEVPTEMVSDAVAQVTVGATSRDLGIILSANTAICKILGYTRLQLERRNISVIVPPPFCEVHDGFMRRYLSTGEGNVVENAMVALARHRQGHLIPVITLIREIPLPDGTPVFQATMRPMSFTDHLVMMDEDWVIQGGTAGALMALGVEPATLSASEVCMADYCPALNDPKSVDDISGRANGAVTQLHLPGLSEGAANGVAESANASFYAGSGGSAGGAGDSRRGSVTDNLDVKAMLSTTVRRGVTINILTWRMLSANETVQRANAMASRRASMSLGGSQATAHVSGHVSGGAPVTPTTGSSTVPWNKLANTAMSQPLNRNVSFRDTTPREVDEMQSDGPGADSARGDEDDDDEDASRVGHGRSFIADEQASQSSMDDASDGDEVGSTDQQTGDYRANPTTTSTTTTNGNRRVNKNPLADGSALDHMPADHPNMLHAALTNATCPVVGKKGMGATTTTTTTSRMRGAQGVKNDYSRDLSAPLSEDSDGDAHLVRNPSELSMERGGDRKMSKGVSRRESMASEMRMSVRSGGSSSKRSSIGRATMSKLRRILADTRGAGASKGVPGLSALFITGWVLFLLNLVLGIITAALLDNNFKLYGANLQFASIAGRTTQAQVRAMRLVAQRALFNRGWIRSTAEREASFGKDMSQMADFFSDSSTRMYELVQGTDRSGFFTDPTLEFADFGEVLPEAEGRVTDFAIKAMLMGNVYWPRSLSTGEVIVGYRRRTTLLDFSATWSGILKQYANMPIENCTNDHRSTLFITTNTQSGAPAHVAIKKAIYQSYLASEDSEKTVTALVLWIFVGMGPVLAFVILCAVIPILLYIDQSRDDIMERFLDLPNLVILYLRAQAEKRLKSLRADDDGDDSDNDEEEEENRRAMGLGSVGDGGIEDIEHADGTVDWDALFARANVEAARADKKKKAILAGTALAGKKGKEEKADRTLEMVSLSPSTTNTTVANTTIDVQQMNATTGEQEDAPLTAKGKPGAKPVKKGAKPSTSTSLCCPTRAKAPAVYPGRTMCSRGKRAPGGGYYRSVVNPDGTVSTFIRRDFRKSSKSLFSLAVFLAPVLLMFLFYLVLYLVTMDTLSRVIAMSSFTSLSALRATALESSMGALFNMMSQTGYKPEEAFRYEYTAQELANLRFLNQLLVFNTRIETSPSVDNGIAPPMDYKKAPGTESSTVPGMTVELMDDIVNAMLKDACPFIATTSDGEKDVAACQNFNGAVLTSGLQAGLRDYIARFRRLRDKRWFATILPNSTDGTGYRRVETSSDWGTDISGSTVDGDSGVGTSVGGTYIQDTTGSGRGAGGPPQAAGGSGGSTSLYSTGLNESVVTYEFYDVKEELMSDDFHIADELVQKYLSPAFLQIAQWYSEAGETIVKTYRLFLMSFVGAFLAVFSAGIFMLYLPAIGKLARDVQSKRAMLLLLPVQVTAKVPSIRALVIQIVAEHEGGASNQRAVADGGEADGQAGGAPQEGADAGQTQPAAKQAA